MSREKLMKEEHAGIFRNVQENYLQFCVTATEEINKKLFIKTKKFSNTI